MIRVESIGFKFIVLMITKEVVMLPKIENARVPEHEVDAIFTDRWSPRSFLPEPLALWQIESLIEAARWSPSCFNEQPWEFVYAVSENDRQRIVETLVEKNQRWAGSAPLLMYLLTKRFFGEGTRPNRHAPFDAGSAWMALALQARRLGLYAHAMAGFSMDKAYQLLKIDREKYEIMCAIAVGRHGRVENLADEFKSKEAPNSRKSFTNMARLLT